jgi:aldehyde:ferredoxin oxidoreductase
MYAYTGRILHIDLSTQNTWVERVEEDFLKKYVGGVGLAARLAYDNVTKGADPLGPENALCFAASAFAGTLVPVGTKHAVAAKSPLTGFLADCLASSYFSSSIKRAGYDGIVIKGKAEKPTYIFIDDDVVEFRDAREIWGKETFETEEAIRAEIGDETVRACTIGLAGENLVRFANLTNDRGRQAGRCGMGAVMGSKLVKAVAIRGTKPVKVADLEGLSKMAFELAKKAQGIKTEKYRILGTPANVLTLNRLGVLPTRNFRQGVFEAAEKVSGEYMHEHHEEKVVACAGCPIACEHVVSVREGPYEGARTSVDYESLFALGTNCGIDYFPGIIKAIELCDRYGMDTMSTGVVVAWAMECFERGILTKEDFDGLEPYFGNHEAEVAIIEKIAKREGIGDILAEGVKRASEKVGKGSEHFAMHVKGLECPGYDPRGLKTFALGAAVGTRGPCHNRSLAYEADAKGEVDRFTSGPERGKIAKEKEEFAALLDILMLCKFIRGCFTDLYSEAAQLYTLATGIETTPEELVLLAERVWNLKKAFNIREGWKKEDDWLPPRFLKDPIPEGASKGCVVTPEELRMMIDAYYEARGWTQEGLIPKEKLIELGLDDIAEEIGV